MDIVKHISDLLYDHECVIVPGLGGFVSNYQPATIHPVQHQFSPPAKNLMFNEALNNNDGLLANHIATQQKMAYEEALEGIVDFVRETKKTLSSGEKVALENIGTIYLDHDGTMQFDQHDKVNYLKDVYGMSTFVSPAIRREAVSTPKVVKPVFENETGRNRSLQNSGLLIKIAATVVVVASLGVFGFSYFKHATPDVNESGVLTSLYYLVNHDAETTSPEMTESGTSDKAEIETHDSDVASNETAALVTGHPAEAAVSHASEVLPEPEIEPVANDDPVEEPVVVTPPAKKMYHLIAGSFLDAENTGTLIQDYTSLGYQPSLIGPSDNGYYRVSIMAYLRKDEALVELRKVRENYNPDIWLLRQ